MKRALLLAALLAVPSISSAFFIEDFFFQSQPPEFVRTVQPSTLPTVQGWPSWIGRLDDFSLMLFGWEYESLTRKQQVQTQELSKEWPSWIGVPLLGIMR
ncbi:hypothetical protein COU79_02950 [Candidatus Peregrinibacteria bacterium CG10_big_fil_rev_8_21_14_0_10_54_7]|nr:MAG: hypothetical protein COU79_02950 [Candidatus Peregrinibacteria bacterium CG10_big_fil_rev_8_21_14_0_10_54_7]